MIGADTPTTVTPRGFGWRIHCGVEVSESSTNKQYHLSPPGVRCPLTPTSCRVDAPLCVAVFRVTV